MFSQTTSFSHTAAATSNPTHYILTTSTLTLSIVNCSNISLSLSLQKTEAQGWVWGSNHFGQLGLGDEISRGAPTPLHPLINKLVQMAAGENNTIALDADGNVYTWGRGQNQVLGNGEYFNISVPHRVEVGKAVFVSCSGHVCAAILEDGSVMTWGNRALGHKGDGRFPTKVEGLPAVKSVSCGRTHILAVTPDGRLFSWGDGHDGALGLGGKADQLQPVEVTALAGTRVVQASAGSSYSIILTDQGEVFSFGAGDYGQTGLGTSAERYTRVPSQIKALSEHKVVDISAGPYHAACTTASGAMFVWGMGGDGQIGNGGNAVHNTGTST